MIKRARCPEWQHGCLWFPVPEAAALLDGGMSSNATAAQIVEYRHAT